MNIITRVFYKTPVEIQNEESLYRFGATIAKGLPKSVCNTYVVIDNCRFDTRDLTEDIILCIFKSCAANNTNFCFELANALSGRAFSKVFLINLLAEEIKYGHFIYDLIGTLRLNYTLEIAREIVKYEKYQKLDFSEVTTSQIIGALAVMISNDNHKRLYEKMKKVEVLA